MKSSIALLLLSSLVSIAVAVPSRMDDLADQKDVYPLKGHERVIRNAMDKTNGFSLLAIGVFGAFVKYMAYHFISKNSEGGERKRSVDDTILDLSRITSCLSEEPKEVLSNFHLHCFFPSFFSRQDNQIISRVIWGSSEKEPVELSLVHGNGSPELKKRRSRDVSEAEETRRLRNLPKAEKPTSGVATGLSVVAVAIVGALAVFSAFNRNSKEEEGRGMASVPVDEYLRDANFILQCLHGEDLAQNLLCLLE